MGFRLGGYLQRVAARPSDGDLSHCRFAVSMLISQLQCEEGRKGNSVEGSARTASVLETRLEAVGRAQTATALVRAATMVEMRMLGVDAFESERSLIEKCIESVD